MTHEQLRLLPYDEECILRDCHELSPIIKPVLGNNNIIIISISLMDLFVFHL